MRYLINNKIYDTEKSIKIKTFIKPIIHKSLFGLYTYPIYQHTLYKTKNGQFFVHIGKYVGNGNISYSDEDYIELYSEDKVKEVLNAINDIDTYKKLFGEIEEG